GRVGVGRGGFERGGVGVGRGLARRARGRVGGRGGEREREQGGEHARDDTAGFLLAGVSARWEPARHAYTCCGVDLRARRSGFDGRVGGGIGRREPGAAADLWRPRGERVRLPERRGDARPRLWRPLLYWV